MVNDIDKRLLTVVRTVLNAPDLVLTDDMSAKSIPGWDSFSHVEIILGIEAEFNCRFSTLEISQLASWGDLRRIVAVRFGS